MSAPEIVRADGASRSAKSTTAATITQYQDLTASVQSAAVSYGVTMGGPGMTLSEVEILMQELGRHVSDQTHILFGAVVDARLGDRLSVTIISSLSSDEEVLLQTPPAPSTASAATPVRERYQPVAPEPEIEPEEPAVEVQPLEETIPFEEPVAAEAPPVAMPTPIEPAVTSARNGEPEPPMNLPQEKPAAWKEEKLPAEKSTTPAKQEVLQFEPVTRGRFEKSEPTIIEGEDLDVPTFLRLRKPN